MDEIKIEEITKTYTEFDYVFEQEFYGRIIQYGIIKGNNKILLIKPGQDGSLIGYHNKYYNLATYINKKYGFSIVCTNNPYDKIHDPLIDAIDVIESYVKFMNFNDYDIYYYGNSNGASIGACNAYKYEKIKRLLLVNPPLFINFHKIEDGIKQFKGDKINFIFGSLDPSYKYVGLLDVLKNTKVSYYILEGEDHNLSNNTIPLESLVVKYLLDE